MDEAPDSSLRVAPASTAPRGMRSKELGAVLRDIREKLELVPLVRPPIEDDEPRIEIDLLKNTDPDVPVSDPPRAVRPGRPGTMESRRYTPRRRDHL